MKNSRLFACAFLITVFFTTTAFSCDENTPIECRVINLESEVYDNSGSAPLFTARPVKATAFLIGIGYLIEESYNGTWSDNAYPMPWGNRYNDQQYTVTNESSPKVFAVRCDEDTPGAEVDVTRRFRFSSKTDNMETCFIFKGGTRYDINRILLMTDPLPPGEYIFRIRMVCSDGTLLETETRTLELL